MALQPEVVGQAAWPCSEVRLPSWQEVKQIALFAEKEDSPVAEELHWVQKP